jgi:hypothetical protein
MMASGWDGETPRIEGAHGNYLPGDDIRWHKVTTDHHKVYLYRVKPGHVNRTRILIGEVRRLMVSTKEKRHWRAFPEGGLIEFPEVFDNHVLALEYLRNRWEGGPVVPEVPRSQNGHRRPKEMKRTAAKPVPKAKPPSWIEFLGGDPWKESDAGA